MLSLYLKLVKIKNAGKLCILGVEQNLLLPRAVLPYVSFCHAIRYKHYMEQADTLQDMRTESKVLLSLWWQQTRQSKGWEKGLWDCQEKPVEVLMKECFLQHHHCQPTLTAQTQPLKMGHLVRWTVAEWILVILGSESESDFDGGH